MSAVRASNLNVGGNVLESNGAWLIVRGVGLIASVDDVKRIVVGGSNGVPIYVEQVANVQIGNAFRVASLVKGTQEAVGGVVVARTGVNTKEVIDAVKARIAQIAPGLPPGVTIVPFYDRSDVDRAGGRHAADGADRRDRARHARARHLPDALPLDPDRHASAAARRADVVPGHVLRRHLLQHHEPRRHRHRDWRARRCRHRRHRERVPIRRAARCRSHAIASRVWETVRDSTRLVGRPVFFSMAIILLAFIPVFALTGQEGKLFHPLAFTKTFAVLAATVIAVTLVPVLCTLLLGGKFHPEEANPVMRGLRAVYRPVLQSALAHRALTITAAAVLFVGALVLARGIGSEFMPPLNEGDLMFMPIADPSISLEENTKIAARQNAALDEVSGSRLRRRQGRARRHVDRSGAAQHDRDDRPPEAEGTSGGRA